MQQGFDGISPSLIAVGHVVRAVKDFDKVLLSAVEAFNSILPFKSEAAFDPRSSSFSGKVGKGTGITEHFVPLTCRKVEAGWLRLNCGRASDT